VERESIIQPSGSLDVVAKEHIVTLSGNRSRAAHLFQQYYNFMFCLQDILENEDVKLDNMFIASLVGDIIRVSRST
jgi:hypothetical protein